MRYIALLMIFAGGCHGPKGADAAPPKNETIVEALERYDNLSAEREKAVAAKVDVLTETVGNQASELEGVKEELRAVKVEVGKLNMLLTVDAEVSQPVPPVKMDAPPAEQAGRRITFRGQPIDVQSWLKRSVTTVEVVGDVDQHLRDHGFAGDFSVLTRGQKIRLHSCAHATGLPAKSTTRVVVRSPVPVMIPQSGNCANGNCQMYGTTQRQRLFGRWR